MQGCTLPMIPAPDIHALLLKEEHGDRLITLRGNMHHVDPEVVLLMNVGSIFD